MKDKLGRHLDVGDVVSFPSIKNLFYYGKIIGAFQELNMIRIQHIATDKERLICNGISLYLPWHRVPELCYKVNAFTGEV